MERIREDDYKPNKRHKTRGIKHEKTNNKAGGTGDCVVTLGSAENNVSPSTKYNDPNIFSM